MKINYLIISIYFSILFPFHTKAQTWSNPIQTVNPNLGNGGFAGGYNSLCIVNGNPAIVFYDGTRGDLIYVRSLDQDGNTWGTQITIDSLGDVGKYASLQIIGGNPAVSYYDSYSGNLKFTRADDTNGVFWNGPTILDEVGDVGLYSSLKEINGNPGISYFDYTNGNLKFIQAVNPDGSSWNSPKTIESLGTIGLYTSLQIINGNPAISYYDETNFDLKFIRSSDIDGTLWGNSKILDYSGNVGKFTSLNIINGNPAISYFDMTNSDLKYIRATNNNGDTWGNSIVLDATGFVGEYTHLEVVNNFPAVSYYSATNSDLKYIRSNNIDGTIWDQPIIVDGSGSTGTYATMNIVNGNPAICYFLGLASVDFSNYNLKYIRSSNNNGTSWGNSIAFDVAANSGIYNSLKIINGNPAIAYSEDADNYDLKYVRSTYPDGLNWSLPKTPDKIGDVGTFLSLQVVNGNPAISYYGGNGISVNDLKYVRSLDPNGNNWGTPITIVSAGFTGLYTSLEVVNGNPAISFYDQTNGVLKFVRANNADGTSWASPITVDGGNYVGYFTSLKIVNGNPAISYYDASNSNLKYVRANDASGMTWNSPINIDIIGTVGINSSLQIVNGKPAISYNDQTNNDIKYVQANDINGSNWNLPVVVDYNGFQEGQTSLQIINGKPAISFCDFANLNLKFCQSLDINGNIWTQSEILDSSENKGQHSSLVSNNSNGAAIAYYSSSKALPLFIFNTSALPINSLEISLKRNDTQIIIKWTVDQESDIDLYEIEKSINGIFFYKIGDLFPLGLNNKIDYQFIDKEPNNGINYYRIIVKGKNNYKKTSEIGKTNFDYLKIDKIIVYPNPVRNNLFYVQGILKKGFYYLTLIDGNGKKILTKTVNHQGGSINEVFTTTLLNSYRNYYLVIKGGGQVLTKKIIQ